MRTIVYDSTSLDTERWNTLCAGDPSATIFHHFEWSRLWELVRHDARAEWWILIDHNDRWIGGIPLVRLSRFGITRLYSLPLGSYGGWVGRRALDSNKAVADWLRRLKRRFVAELVVTPFPTESKIPYPGREVVRKRYVLELPAAADGSWREGLRDDITRNLRTAAGFGWQIDLVKNLDDVERTQDLWGQTFSRHQRRFDSSRWNLYRQMVGLFTAGKQLFWWTASDDRGPAGTIICLYSGDRFFYYDGAMDTDRKDGRPMFALFDIAIDTAVKLGCRYFDFGSGPDSATGLTRFKEGWGATAELYFEYHFKRAWWPKK